MRSIASHTEGVLIVPQGILSSQKESFACQAKDSFCVEQGTGIDLHFLPQWGKKIKEWLHRDVASGAHSRRI